MANTTMTQIPAGVAAFYDKNILMRAVPFFVHDKFGVAKNLPSKDSESIKFRTYSNLAAASTPLTEGVTPSGSQLTVNDITATVVQYGDFVTLTDKIAMHVEDNVVKEATDILGDQAGLTLDTAWRDSIVPNMTNVKTVAANEAATVAGDTISAASLDQAILSLKKNLAKKFTSIISGSDKVGTSPVRSAYMSIVHPDVVYDLEGVSGYKNVADYAALGSVAEGEVGSYKDIRFIETTQGYINTDGGASAVDTYHTPIFGKEGYGIVSLRGKGKFETFVKPLGSAGTADPIDQRSSVGWKASTVAKILNQNFMVSVISSSSQGTNA